MINLGGEVGCMISEGPWIFIGVTNFVKVNYITLEFFFFFGGEFHMVCKRESSVNIMIPGYVMIFQAWNTQTNTDLSLSGPVGQVYAMAVGNDLLFAGTQVISFTSRLFVFSF